MDIEAFGQKTRALKTCVSEKAEIEETEAVFFARNKQIEVETSQDSNAGGDAMQMRQASFDRYSKYIELNEDVINFLCKHLDEKLADALWSEQTI